MLNWWTVFPLLISVTVGWLGYQIKSESSAPQIPPTMPQDILQDLLQEVSSDYTTPQDCFPREQQFWAYYSSGPGTTVKGWPSQGGIYTLDVSSRIEIEFLELDPFNNTRRPTNSDPEWQQKENTHCDRMRRLGPTWWPSDLAWVESEISGMLDERSNNYVRVGWTPDGGAWVWKTTKKDASEKGGAKLQNARTMEERCIVIERLGGTVYAASASPAAVMDNYKVNQASTWIHELLHIDWVALANRWGPNAHVTDIKMEYNFGKSKRWVPAYGPYLNKGLARVQTQFADWTIQNADNMSLFALAKFVQNKLGDIYPHLPLAPPPPEDVKGFVVPGYFDYYSDGTGEILNQTAMDDVSWSASLGTCALGTDPDGAAESAAIATVTSWPVETDYPSDYLSSWSSWAGLTPTTTTTTTAASATATESWSIAIYREKGCAGDYYVDQGYNEDTPSDKCLVISDLTPTLTNTGVSCRWYTDEGATFTTCDKGNLTEPLSWEVIGLGAICTVFSTDACTSIGEDAYDSSEVCHDYSSRNDAQTWIALKCGLND